MKLQDTKGIAISNGHNEEFVLVLEQLAIAAQRDLTSLNEDISFGIPSGDDIEVIKQIIKNTFSFIIRGNVFVYVNERQLTRASIDKLGIFYHELKGMASRVEQESISTLFELLASYILYAETIGSTVVKSGTQPSATWFAEASRLSNEGYSEFELDPMIFFIVELGSSNKQIFDILERELGRSSYDQANDQLNAFVMTGRPSTSPFNESFFNSVIFNAAKTYAKARVIQKAGEIVNNEIQKDADAPEQEGTLTYEISQEMIKRFLRLAKTNPRKAAKVLKDMYDVAPEEYQEVFWDAMKVGVKKSFIKKARGFLLGLGSSIFGK